MAKKKKEQSDDYVSESTVDDEPREEREEEEETEADEESQQELFAKFDQPDRPGERKEDLVVTIQIGAAKLIAIKAKEVPTSMIPELIIKRLVASRHLRKMIAAILDLPHEAEFKAFEYTEGCAERVRTMNSMREYEYEQAKKQRDEEAKAAKEKADRDERKKSFRRVKPGEAEQESPEPPTYEDQVTADHEADEAPPTF